MKIACDDDTAAQEVIGVLQRHGIRRGVSWNGPNGIDTAIWIHVSVPLEPAVEAAIRGDIAAIAGAAIQD